MQSDNECLFVIFFLCDSIISYVLSERGVLPAERLRQAEEITPAMAREAFLESQKEVFTRLTQEEVTDRANSIALSLEEPPKSYLEEASDYHDSLMSDMPLDWRELVIGELRAMSLDAFRSRAEVLVLDERTRKSVAVMLYGSKAVVDLRARGGETVLASIEEVTALRESLEYY